MVQARIRWKLEGGYSRFVDGSRLEIELRHNGMAQSLAVSPLSRSRPVDYSFRLRRVARVRGPWGLRWELGPEGGLRCRILFAGNAYLGNFRVPKDHFAVQWDAEGVVLSPLQKRSGGLLMEIGVRSRLVHTWVEVFPAGVGVEDAFRAAWGGYRDPFQAEEVLAVNPNQIIRWRWSGRLRLRFQGAWRLREVWALPTELPVIRTRREALAETGLPFRFEATELGQFFLQLRRQSRNLEVRINRESESGRSRRVAAAASLASTVRLLGPVRLAASPLQALIEDLSRPALNRLQRAVDRALLRKLEIGLAVERLRWKRNASRLNATWLDPEPDEFKAAFERLLGGEAPEASLRLRVRGRIERIQGRRVSLDVNILNWIRFSRTRQRRREEYAVVGPGGELVWETVDRLEHERRWRGVQFLKLAVRSQGRGIDSEGKLLWTRGFKGRVSQPRLSGWLRQALKTGMISGYHLPERKAFPLTIDALAATEFTREGLLSFQKLDRQAYWNGLVRSFEISESERHQPGSPWRDWMDFPEVIETVRKDPVQGHLVTRYPVAGRSDAERILIINRVRRILRFLDLLEGWKSAREIDPLEAFELGNELPISLFLHLICPPEKRRSVVVLRGGWEALLGDEDLAVSLW